MKLGRRPLPLMGGGRDPAGAAVWEAEGGRRIGRAGWIDLPRPLGLAPESTSPLQGEVKPPAPRREPLPLEGGGRGPAGGAGREGEGGRRKGRADWTHLPRLLGLPPDSTSPFKGEGGAAACMR